MLPLMLPVQRRLDMDADVGLFSIYTRLEGYATVVALGRVQPGQGVATANGVALSRWEAVALKGVTLIFLPVSEVAPEYGQRYIVEAVHFRDHMRIHLYDENRTIQVILALPDATRFTYISI